MARVPQLIEQLKAGETLQIRAGGNSMIGRLEPGALCTIEPLRDASMLAAGDIVLCRVRRTDYLHLIKAINGDSFLIGDNRGHINGWTPASKIFGKCVKAEP